MSEPTADGRTGRVPASCVFWIEAETGSFLTVPEDHGNCSVGRYVHKLVEAEDILDKTDVGALLDTGWVTMDAFAAVARIEEAPAAIEYGPLADAEHMPDVVMMRLSPRQMMELGDAVPGVRLSGKPQCQIMPLAAAGEVAVSMGCALSRARTGMSDDELTCAVPGDRLEGIVEALESVCRADGAVVDYALADKARF
jgi:uncharacterized protein (DUF169 family)